jgi:hypothetical protein
MRLSLADIRFARFMKVCFRFRPATTYWPKRNIFSFTNTWIFIIPNATESHPIVQMLIMQPNSAMLSKKRFDCDCEPMFRSAAI